MQFLEDLYRRQKHKERSVMQLLSQLLAFAEQITQQRNALAELVRCCSHSAPMFTGPHVRQSMKSGCGPDRTGSDGIGSLCISKAQIKTDIKKILMDEMTCDARATLSMPPFVSCISMPHYCTVDFKMYGMY